MIFSAHTLHVTHTSESVEAKRQEKKLAQYTFKITEAANAPINTVENSVV